MLGPAANLRFVELQSWGEHVWNFSHERAEVERDGNLDWIFGAIGSHLTKNFSEFDLVGRGQQPGGCRVSILPITTSTWITIPSRTTWRRNTTSDLLFKGALLDESRSVWQGMIYVAPGAQKTDGYQANRNLVLSTQGPRRLDPRAGNSGGRCALHPRRDGWQDRSGPGFLPASRAVSRRVEAERLIVEGFFDPIMQRIPFEGVRERFQQAIHEKMSAYTG